MRIAILAASLIAAPLTHAVDFDKSSHIVVKRFETAGADLGKAKQHDTALAMAKAAPHLLAVDIVQFLRRDGFTNVTLDESGAPTSEDSIVLTGRFTDIDPGSQAARVWIGFGAGHSKVCVEGSLSDSAGNEVAAIKQCNAGIGWGDSSSNLGDEARHLGHKVADQIAAAAEK